MGYAPNGLETMTGEISRSGRSAEMGRHGRLVVGPVLQHRRGRQGEARTTPASWADLIKPEYKGQITMPNPASSGTGYLMVSAWLQMMGEEKGWAYMDALHQNIAAYTHSGSKPCKQAAAGEYTIGLSFEYRANKSKKDGAPIDVMLPEGGRGLGHGGVGASWPRPRSSMTRRSCMDWSVTQGSQRALCPELCDRRACRASPSRSNCSRPTSRAMLIKNDFAWAAANRERILAEWSKRYDGKSEPKS